MTLASHASAALRDETALRLPAHPAFMVVRRATWADGGIAAGVDAWFEVVRADGGPVVLADAGIDGDAAVSGRHDGWRIAESGGAVVIEPAPWRAVSPPSVDTAAEVLRSTVDEVLRVAAGAGPPLWNQAAYRAVAILGSAGTGEELSDVAWPHFLLPQSCAPAQLRLAAAAATLWLWDGPGAWTGPAADRAHDALRPPVATALIAAVAADHR